MTKRLSRLVSLLAAATLASGCASDDGGAAGGAGGTGGTGGTGPLDCSFEPCGGDLDGTWRIQTACAIAGDSYDVYPLATNCNDQPYSLEVSANGNIIYDAGTEEWRFTVVKEERLTVTASCLEILWLMEGVHCGTLAGAGCDSTMVGDDCVVSCLDVQNWRGSGGFTVEGDSIRPGSGGDRVPFCVDGDELRQRRRGFSLVLRRLQ